jgi:hypothetical protein
MMMPTYAKEEIGNRPIKVLNHRIGLKFPFLVEEDVEYEIDYFLTCTALVL